MREELAQRFQNAFVELNDAYDALEAANMDMDQICVWLREWLDIKEGNAVNGHSHPHGSEH